MANIDKLFNEHIHKCVSGFDFYMKNYNLFVDAQIECKFKIPYGTLTKLHKGRKPAKHHLKALDTFRDYLLNELKKRKKQKLHTYYHLK